MQNAYTELAYERYRASDAIPGCRYTEKTLGTCRLHTLYIESEDAARAMDCGAGMYQTLFFSPIAGVGENELAEITKHVAHLLAQTANRLLTDGVGEGKRILIAALGNRDIAADAIGPLSADRIIATAHLRNNRPDILTHLHCAEIAILSPGVTMQSGIESAHLISTVAERFQPHFIIAIDALAARSAERLSTTLQISDAGVCPGAGTDSRHAVLDRPTLGCPVISIGAPTVTHAAALMRDLLDSLPLQISPGEEERLIASVDDCFLTLQDTNRISTRYATVIAQAINRAFGVPHL